jgi:hypothetical protein
MDDHFRHRALSFIPLIVVWIVMAVCPPVSALGRKPADEKDHFPDYNRLEFRRKPPEPIVETPAISTPSIPAPPPMILPPPAPIVPDAPPKPPPAAVPISADDSEPALPDDMMKTLSPSATNQTPAPTK